LGATVIGTVSSEEKARLARDHGCHHVIVTRDYRFSEAVMQASSGHGVDLIIDGLGKQAMTENLSAPATFGHWVSLGRASGAIPTVDRSQRTQHFPRRQYCITPAIQRG
jgi:NADPH:quinone reductase